MPRASGAWSTALASAPGWLVLVRCAEAGMAPRARAGVQLANVREDSRRIATSHSARSCVFSRLAMACPLLSSSGEWAFYRAVGQGETERGALPRALRCPNAEDSEVRAGRGCTFHAERPHRSGVSLGAPTLSRGRGTTAPADARSRRGQARRSRRGDLPCTVRGRWRNAGKLPCIRPRVDHQRTSGKQQSAAQDSQPPESRAVTTQY